MSKNSLRWRKILDDYFTFSRSQRRAVIILLAIFVCIFIPLIYQFFFKNQTKRADDILLKQVSLLKVQEENNNEFENKRNRNSDYTSYREPDKGEVDLFPFDPNELSPADWKRLGLRDKTISTIHNYLLKGGRFNKPEDLKKIYGLREEEVARLMPYVRINTKTNKSSKSNDFYTNKEDGQKLIDINVADTSAFISLPGIGSKLAFRIVNYREKLGGFYTVDQVGETYGISDSVFQIIKPRLIINTKTLRKININNATVNELKMPYIPYNIANAIFQYRTHNGNFHAVEELKKIPIIDEPLFEKIAPYLVIE